MQQQQQHNVPLSEKVAIKIKTGQKEFLGGKLAVPNGRGDLLLFD